MLSLRSVLRNTLKLYEPATYLGKGRARWLLLFRFLVGEQTPWYLDSKFVLATWRADVALLVLIFSVEANCVCNRLASIAYIRPQVRRSHFAMLV